MAISPDGKDIVFIALEGVGGRGPRLFLKRAGNFGVIELKGTNAAGAPFFSPDGRWIGYVNDRTDEIYKILVDGGEPLKVASEVSGVSSGLGTGASGEASATWAPDNTIIFSSKGVLKRIPESGGEPAILTKIKSKGEKHLYPHMLPDGKTVLFTVGYPSTELNSYRLAVYGLGRRITRSFWMKRDIMRFIHQPDTSCTGDPIG